MEVNTETQFERLFIEEEGNEIDYEDDRVKQTKTIVLKANKEDTEHAEEEARKSSSGGGEGGDRETEVNNIIQDSALEIKRQYKEEIDERKEEVNEEQMREHEGREKEKWGSEEQPTKTMYAEMNKEDGSQTQEGIKKENTRVADTVRGQDGARQQGTTKVKPELQLLHPVSSEHKSEERLRPQDAEKQIRRLTPDFPDSLYELLCSLQEGRRLNDQRCSFTMERRCHSEPSTPVPRHRVVFSSMTSLQKEEFFEFVATSQSRRLDDQRAELLVMPAPQPLPLAKAKERKTSLKGARSKRGATQPAPREELYNMIRTSQAQGRLEEQRSSAPGPMDDEDFFSLLLKVQGGRIDEQRTEFPITLRD